MAQWNGPNDKLQCVLDAVAAVVSNTRKYDQGLSRFQRDKLHWLDVVVRVQLQSVCPGIQSCLHNTTPGYLSSLCQLVSSVPGRRHLRSADRGELDYFCNSLASFAIYAGPTTWSLVPDDLKKH